MGVRRAVELVLKTTRNQKGPIYTFGQLIHNPQVLDMLAEKGIRILDEIPKHGSGTVLIRAHGVPPDIKSQLSDAGFNILDATCPRVIKIQTIIQKYTRQENAIIIVGDPHHPEVVGLRGYANSNGHVVKTLEEFEALPAFDKAVVVAQTTQNARLFEKLQTRILAKHPHYKVFETICDATEKRQAEIKKLSQSVDAVVVVGGRNSGNTRRLAEIAKESDRPVFHIETENDFKEIEVDTLTAAASVGITAGASTPNWVIKKVYRALEQLPYLKKSGWRGFLFNIQRSLLLTNIYVSLGAGCLSYACARLLEISPSWPYIAMSVFYVQSMHLCNRLIGNKGIQFNDPERASFYKRNRTLLALTALISGSSGLLIALLLGVGPFLVLLAMSIMGVSYNLQFRPTVLPRLTFRKIRDIPGSKTILIAVAWGVLAAILPPLATRGQISWISVMLFAWSAGLVFVRTAFFDILDMQCDKFIGKETIAIMLGEKWMMRFLEVILAALIVMLPLATVLHVVPTLGYWLTCCPIFMFIILGMYKNGYLRAGIRLEFLVETLFLLAGCMALFYPPVQ